ncbi:MAG: anti-phage BREX system Lon protease BrxL [Candidatus Entotheonellia bacterium]
MRDKLDHARGWFRKGESDLLTTRRALTSEVPYDTACFHAQQVAEKYFKGLLGKYCATDDPAAIDAGLRVVNTTLAANFVRPDEANRAQSLVKERGKHTFIDKVKVRYLADDDKYWAELVNFGHRYIHVPDSYPRRYERLLMGGIWAQIDLRHQYDEEARGKRSPFWTVSGLVKLLYPHGDVARAELAELVEIALEGRRRVKEQLKKMGAFEYHQTSFSYIESETREERFVGVPEQGGRDMISTDPLAPGSVYTATVDDHGKVGLYRLEVGCTSGADSVGKHTPLPGSFGGHRGARGPRVLLRPHDGRGEGVGDDVRERARRCIGP